MTGTSLPASAASPVVTGGLVNVTIANVANNNQVAVPIQVAAAICGVQVGVLSTVLATEPVSCSPSNGNRRSPLAAKPPIHARLGVRGGS